MPDAPVVEVPWRVVVADDEPLARLRLRTLLARDARFVIVAECEDGREALDALARHRPAVLFLDVRMPELDGVAVAQALATGAGQGRGAPAIVFVTAYDSHAVDAFDLDAIDYLVKPVDMDRFDRMLARLAQRLQRTAGEPGSEASGIPADALRAALAALAALASRPPAPTYAVRLAVRDAKGVYFVEVTDVERVEADGNYVVLCTRGRRHLVRESMRSMEERLDPARFVRVHRSAIVSLAHVTRLEPWGHGEYVITMRDGTKLTSSRTYSSALQALIRPVGDAPHA